jgi:hypothetical protein
MIAAEVVEWGTLGKVILAALVTGVGVTSAFAIAILGATRSVEMRRAGRGPEATGFAALAFVAFVVVVAAIVGGIVEMSEKS